MVAPRRVIALPTDAEQRQRLGEISRSRTEPTSRVERARIILAYLAEPSAYAVARTIGVTQQTVTRCLERAAELGVIEALDDRPRAVRDPVITAAAKTWLVALACRKAKELGYPHELWTTRLLAAPVRARSGGVLDRLCCPVPARQRGALRDPTDRGGAHGFGLRVGCGI